MVCPNCKHEQELTWKKYFSFKKYLCQKCKCRYKVLFNFFHLLEMMALTTFTGSIIIIVSFYFFNFHIVETAIISLALVSFLILPLDKSFANHKAKARIVKEPEKKSD